MTSNDLQGTVHCSLLQCMHSFIFSLYERLVLRLNLDVRNYFEDFSQKSLSALKKFLFIRIEN